MNTTRRNAPVSVLLADKVGSLLSMNIPVTPVPEPQSWAMLFGGLSLIGAMARRRKWRT